VGLASSFHFWAVTTGWDYRKGLDRLLMADSPTSQFPNNFFNSSASL
jgi:hypothetical protein